jgi:ribose transport system substrate-binding protein
MKKNPFLIFFVTAVLVLFGAVWPGASANLHAEPAKPEKTYLIGFAQDTMANDWRAEQVYAVERTLKKYPFIRFVYTDAKGQVAKNVQDIEDLADLGIDLLIVSPRNPRVMTPVISQLYRRGIPVVLLTRQMTNDDFTTFIGPNDVAIAENAADFLADALGGTGRVLVLQGVPTATTAIMRTRGFVNGIGKHPGLEIAAIKPANYLRSDAARVVQETLEAGLKFDAIFAQSDSMAIGARLALRAAGLDPKSLHIVGIDYIPEARKAIREGRQAASFTYPTCGKEGAEIAVQILTGQKTEKRITVPTQIVTKDNVDQVEPIF